MKRLGAENPQERIILRTKKKQKNLLLNSPTLRYIDIINKEERVPVIISEDKRIKEKRFLFLPDKEIKVGWVIRDRNKKYLALNRSDDDIYPQLFCELCNYDYKLQVKKEKEFKGYDELGNPIFEDSFQEIRIPGVAYTNVYTATSNKTLTLPSGVVKLRLPYSKLLEENVSINEEHTLNYGKYLITDISKENVFNDEGYLEISLQRRVEKA